MNIQDIKLNVTCFESDNHVFRTSNFYFIYTYSNGDRELIICNREDANGIGGSGVCGWIDLFEDVNFVSEECNFSESRIADWETSRNKRIEEASYKLNIFKSLEQGLDKSVVDDIVLEIILEDTLNNM